MAELITEVDIGAPPALVWRVLTDLPAYGQWNPLVSWVAGQAVLGARLTLRLHVPGKPPITVKPTITALEPEARLVWKGFALAPGFFDGEHRFELSAFDDGRACRVKHAERFEGVLVPIVGPLLLQATRVGFIAMNEALRHRVETVAKSTT